MCLFTIWGVLCIVKALAYHLSTDKPMETFVCLFSEPTFGPYSLWKRRKIFQSKWFFFSVCKFHGRRIFQFIWFWLDFFFLETTILSTLLNSFNLCFQARYPGSFHFQTTWLNIIIHNFLDKYFIIRYVALNYGLYFRLYWFLI